MITHIFQMSSVRSLRIVFRRWSGWVSNPPQARPSFGYFAAVLSSWPTPSAIKELYLENLRCLTPQNCQNLMEALRSHGEIDTVEITTDCDEWSDDAVAAIASGLPHIRAKHFSLLHTDERLRWGERNRRKEYSLNLSGILNNYEVHTVRIDHGRGTGPLFSTPLLATATSRNRAMSLFKSINDGIDSSLLLPRALEKPAPDALFLALVEYPLLLPDNIGPESPFKRRRME